MQNSENGQVPFSFPERIRFGEEEFHVSSANFVAAQWVLHWPHPGINLACLCGPPGCGKTHLAAIWRKKAKALPLRAGAWQESVAVMKNHPAFFWEYQEQDFAQSQENQEGFFHFLNALRAIEGHFLMIAPSAPAYWPVFLDDLASRLRTITVLPIHQPDDALCKAVLLKRLQDRQIRANMRLINYLVTHMERSFRAIDDIIDRLDSYALATKQPVSWYLAQKLLARQKSEVSGEGSGV